MKLPHLFTTVAFALALTTTTHAVMVWGPATGIVSDTDVSTSGTLVGAFNVGGPGALPATINGVTFAPFNWVAGLTLGNFSFAGPALGFNDSNTTAALPFGNLSTGYKEMLSRWGSSASDPLTLTMSGLTVGNNYQFQWWANSSVSSNAPITATDGAAVTLQSNTTNTVGGLGQYAIGAFTATAATEVITFTEVGPELVLVNGFQLRNVTNVTTNVPDSGPGTALLGLALLGVTLVRRRR